MDLQVAGLDDLKDRFETALDRVGELQAGTNVESDTFFSGQFMTQHTEFDSFAAFCDHSPWDLDDRGHIKHVSQPRLDEYVAARTDFESWEAMKTQAAVEDLVDQVVA